MSARKRLNSFGGLRLLLLAISLVACTSDVTQAIALDSGISEAGVDASLLDLPPRDASPLTCSVDEQCSAEELGFHQICDPQTHHCAFCAPSRPDTCAETQFCSEGRCLPGCARDQACRTTPTTPFCDQASHRCVACLSDGDCGSAAGATSVCTDHSCGFRCNSGHGDCDGLISNGCEIDLTSALSHCGRCSNRCPDASHAVGRCSSGGCDIACEDPFRDCDADRANGCESDSQSDARNCGACGRLCPSPPNAERACAVGICGFHCAVGFADCDGDPGNGCEIDLRSDPRHCGACETACTASAPYCDMTDGGARCATHCSMGETLCGTSCVDVRVSTDHCGSCASACARLAGADVSCADGACRFVCVSGMGDCDGIGTNGCEVDVLTSEAHCGGCGIACSMRANAAVSCVGSECRFSCMTGFADCDHDSNNGCEVDTRVSAPNCGACGVACSGGARCVSGVCETCPTGQTFCGGRCVNTISDRANCGACGRDCLRGACSAGRCAPYLVATLPTSRAVTLSYDGTYLYSGGHFEGTLYRVVAEPPGTPERLYDGVGYLTGVQCYGETLFWNSYMNSNVFRAAANGSGSPSSAPLGVSDPGDILVEDDFIYTVSYQSSTSPVFRISRTGGAPTLFATIAENGGGELFRMRGGGDLLVSGQYHDTIWRISSAGGVSLFLHLGAGRAAQQLGMDDQALYVTSYVGPVGAGQVLRVDLATLTVTPIINGLDSPYGLVVTDTMIYFSNYFAHDIWAMRK